MMRSSNDRIRPNCWDLTGGHIDPNDIIRFKNESGRGDSKDILVQGLLREVREETGLDVDLIKTLHSASGFVDGKFIIALAYLVKTSDPKIFV